MHKRKEYKDMNTRNMFSKQNNFLNKRLVTHDFYKRNISIPISLTLSNNPTKLVLLASCTPGRFTGHSNK